jgi:hypothetical protein
VAWPHGEQAALLFDNVFEIALERVAPRVVVVHGGELGARITLTTPGKS